MFLFSSRRKTSPSLSLGLRFDAAVINQGRVAGRSRGTKIERVKRKKVTNDELFQEEESSEQGGNRASRVRTRALYAPRPRETVGAAVVFRGG